MLCKVNRHTPSRGCAPCRQKRSKVCRPTSLEPDADEQCDRKQKSCGQCVRASRKCYGYRDDFELVTISYSGKATKSQRNLSSQEPVLDDKTPAKSKSTGRSARTSSTTHQLSHSAIFPSLTQPHTTTAIGFLFHRLSTSTFSDYAPVLLQHSLQDSVLQTSLSALALCYLSDDVQSLSLKHEAQIAYSAALKKLHHTIQQSEEANLNDTIASSLLLAQYQSFANNSPQAWSVHVHGALALVDQYITKSSMPMPRHETQVMIVQTISLVQLDCLVNDKSLPTKLNLAFENSSNAMNENASVFFLLVQLAMKLTSDMKAKPCSMDQLDHAELLDDQAIQLLHVIPNEDYQSLLSMHSEARRRVSTAHTLLVLRAILNDTILELVSRLREQAADDLTFKLTGYAQRAMRSLTRVHEAIYQHVPSWIYSTKLPDLDMWLCSLIWPFSYQLSLRHLSQELKQNTRAQLLKLAEISTHPGLKRVITDALKENTTDYSYTLYLC